MNELISLKNQVIFQDISYQDGVLEILDERDDIDKLLISTEIYGEYEFKHFIEMIIENKNNIEIVIFSNDIKKLDINFLNSKNIFEIYENNESSYNYYLNKINSEIKISEKEIKEEIKKIKNEIVDKKQKNSINTIKENEDKSNKTLMYCVLGAKGVGKSVFSTILAKFLEEINKKVLIIEINDSNQSSIIGSIYGIKYEKEEIIKLSSHIDLLILEKSFNENRETLNKKNIMNKVEKIKSKYDTVLIDVNDYIETHLLEKSNNVLFLLEPNVVEIKKSRKLLKRIIEEKKIKFNKINIILNKVNKYSLDENITKSIFKEYKVIGNINYNEKYNLYINRKTKCFLEKREYEKIYNYIKEESL